MTSLEVLSSYLQSVSNLALCGLSLAMLYFSTSYLSIIAAAVLMARHRASFYGRPPLTPPPAGALLAAVRLAGP